MKVEGEIQLKLTVTMNGSELATLKRRLLEASQHLEGDNGGPLKQLYEALLKADAR